MRSRCTPGRFPGWLDDQECGRGQLGCLRLSRDHHRRVLMAMATWLSITFNHQVTRCQALFRSVSQLVLHMHMQSLRMVVMGTTAFEC